jgi:hypothetical protein
MQRGRGTLTGSHPCFLLIAWVSYMIPSRTAVHFFIAIRIRVKVLQNKIHSDKVSFKPFDVFCIASCRNRPPPSLLGATLRRWHPVEKEEACVLRLELSRSYYVRGRSLVLWPVDDEKLTSFLSVTRMSYVFPAN